MKILHVNYYDQYSGSGRAAYRIHQAIRQITPFDSGMLVMDKDSGDPDVTALPLGVRTATRFKQRLAARVIGLQRDSNPCAHSLNLFDNAAVLNAINRSDADLVHLHWLGGEMLSVRQFPKIAKPVVWTMHDTWPFCGSEHYMNPLTGETRYRDGYTAENRESGARGLDIDRMTWKRKHKYNWSDLPFLFAAPSQWLADAFRASELFHGHDCEVIENPIDIKTFRLHSREEARERFRLPADKKIILFGAQSLDAPVKGMSKLREAFRIIRSVSDPKDFHLVGFGANAGALLYDDTGFDGMDVGSIHNEALLSTLYAAADVFVAPSLIENLPCTVVEALACGTPVAAFKTGGIPEVVKDGVNGCLAENFDPVKLADAIIECIGRYDQFGGQNARAAVETRFSMNAAAEKYGKLYGKRMQK